MSELAKELLGVSKVVRPAVTSLLFVKNYNDMNNAGKYEGKDKYFHAKANCQAGHLYDLPTALALDYGKEAFDIAKKNGFAPNGLPLSDNLLDSVQDLGADGYGFLQGVLHPFTDCKILLKDLRPSGLNPKY